MEKLLELNNVSAGYDNNIVLADVNMQVFDRDFIGVIGPNGGGKTTLVKVILGLLKPMKGEITFHENTHNFIGYLPQINRIDSKFPITVLDVVLSGLMSQNQMITGFNKLVKKRAEELLEQTGITHLRKRPIGELSGGQLQRVFLCRALIASPRLLILDEPSSYVDNKFENELYGILHELNKEMAIIMVSHDVGTITSYVKTIACVNRQLNYHQSNVITEEQLVDYNCPIQIISHGDVPHTVLEHHH
jgi:zinc transport system ATP-binding protein